MATWRFLGAARWTFTHVVGRPGGDHNVSNGPEVENGRPSESGQSHGAVPLEKMAMTRSVRLHEAPRTRRWLRRNLPPDKAEELKTVLRRSEDEELYAARISYLSDVAKRTVEVEPILKSIFAQIGSRWGTQIIVCLGAGSLRFSTLQKLLAPISKRVLSMNLRSLERDGLISRTADGSSVVQVHYQLTPMGRELFKLVWNTIDWVIENVGEIEAARAGFDLRNP